MRMKRRSKRCGNCEGGRNVSMMLRVVKAKGKCFAVEAFEAEAGRCGGEHRFTGCEIVSV